jgi:hypothetical protein
MPLTAKGENGSEPSGSPPGWQQIVDARLTTDNTYRYVRLHLVNHNFGGKGITQNLTPGTKRNNTDHLHNVEVPIKKLIGSGRLAKDATTVPKGARAVLWYNLRVQYHSGGTPDHWPKGIGVEASHFAQSILMSWGTADKDGKAWKRGPQLGGFTLGPIPIPPFDTHPPGTPGRR